MDRAASTPLDSLAVVVQSIVTVHYPLQFEFKVVPRYPNLFMASFLPRPSPIQL